MAAHGWTATRGPVTRRILEESRDLFVEAFGRAPDDYYLGINAAAKSALLGPRTTCAAPRNMPRRSSG